MLNLALRIRWFTFLIFTMFLLADTSINFGLDMVAREVDPDPDPEARKRAGCWTRVPK